MSAEPSLLAEPEADTAEVEVVVLAWPARDREREELAAAGRPRLLVIGDADPPPAMADELEDWLREPVDLVELAVRSATLRARSRSRLEPPRLEPDGIVRRGAAWVALSAAQVPLVEVLIADLGQLVRMAELRRLHAAGGGADDELAVAAVLRRLAPALAQLGLRLHRLRGLGYLLDGAAGPPAATAEARRTPHRRPGKRVARIVRGKGTPARLARARPLAADR